MKAANLEMGAWRQETGGKRKEEEDKSQEAGARRKEEEKRRKKAGARISVFTNLRCSLILV